MTEPSPAGNTDEFSDGRRAKGERRRRALVEATLRVIERDGASGVTHRSVAGEAGLPTTTPTYYFDGIDGLLTAVLTSCLDEDATRLRLLTDTPGDNVSSRRALAELMAERVAGRSRLLAEFELCLLAARRPELRDSTDRWAKALAGFARRHTADPARVELFVGAYDGLLLRALLADRKPTPDEFEAMLRSLLPDEPGARA
ncbi:TetR/AcrR family transcriptional regulator [Amycolatopsis samaneae]|uniref:TetR/AcrR family transcriptional regulator n=1 Tax=Amycolatopsis samaneae TaxID=664691 RepID=A0ABW5GX59_9PSEU